MNVVDGGIWECCAVAGWGAGQLLIFFSLGPWTLLAEAERAWQCALAELRTNSTSLLLRTFAQLFQQ